MAEISPFFSLHSSHVQQLLESCPQLGQQLLQFDKDRNIRFCSDHILLDAQAKSTWRLHAGLLHFLLQPLVTFYKNACEVASIALSDARPTELELAFRGQARNSFLWLQCLLAEEKPWCTRLGCPACSATHTLHSEMTIRGIITAILVAKTIFQEYEAPDLKHILDALAKAVSADPFWNSMHYPHFLARSEVIAEGFEDLRLQCVELDILISSPPGSDGSVASIGSLGSMSDDGSEAGFESSLIRNPSTNLIKMRPSSVARRQMSLKKQQILAAAELASNWTLSQEAQS